MRKLLTAGTVFGLVAGLLISTPGTGAVGGTPNNPAASPVLYGPPGNCYRVFSDPHAYWPAPAQPLAGRSPFAKGAAACAATDFYTYNEMVTGVTFLENLFPRFVEFYNLEQDFGGNNGPCANSNDPQDYCSAGLPRQGLPPDRVKSEMYMIRVTDEQSPVPEAEKKFFAFPLSIHGIERAGAEAGVRMAEDLATWAYCEAVAAGSQPSNGLTQCLFEGAIPHPLLESQAFGPQHPNNLFAGDVLKQSSIYFLFSNPDGWRRGDPDNLVRFFQRYNGNGVDLNRDWPTQGFTYRPYTPWSEPETRGFGKVLQGIKSKWAGGIDLHGQLIDRAYSFTLMGATERDYGKDQRILQAVKGAWVDAENRLGWHPLIIPNDAPRTEPQMYGVQWGTVWDTINYQVTGAHGDWIDSPIGLDGDGIDNEMSMSHLINCGIGSCYLHDFEQLHVDGNKSLVYSMVNYTLLPEDQHFEVPGQVGYIFDPTVLTNSGTPTPPPTAGLQPQPAQNVLLSAANNFRHQFTVFGPETTPAHYNGGLEGKATPVNISGMSQSSVTSLVVERHNPQEPPVAEDNGCGAAGDEWEEVNRYFNQSSAYLQSGQAVHANQPTAGEWRICVTGGLVVAAGANGVVNLDITFSTEKTWEDPGQLPYSVTNMNFFEDLAPYMDSGQLVPVNVADVLSGAVSLRQFNSLVIADNPAPGLADPPPQAYVDKLRSFVLGGGNLVLTDGALKNLGHMGLVAPSAIDRHHVYAGYIGFTRDNGATSTYSDPLAFNVNQPGAAEGSGHRHQTYEPVPIGFDIGNRQSCSGEPPPSGPATQCTSPVWTVDQTAWEASGGRTVGQINANRPSGTRRVGFGELTVGRGRVRIIGALLPMPTERYYHPFGLANYALTYSGYQVFKNVLQWTRPLTTRSTTRSR